MRLMYDDFMQSRSIYSSNEVQTKLARQVIPQIKNFHPTPIDITNVWEYCLNHGAWISDNSGLTLPFNNVFFEYSARADLSGKGYRIGIYVSQSDRLKDGGPAKILDDIYGGERWSCWACTFHQFSTGQISGPMVHYHYRLDENGSLVGEAECEAISTDRANDYSQEILMFDLWVALFAVKLMNCRNVKLVDNAPLPLTRAERRRGDPERVAYKTIKVLPIRKIYNEAESGEEPESGLMPLHICRGHFKDFRNGPGLFGKYREIFWWEQHVRGKTENGQVIKDYEVIAPTDE